MSFPLTVHPGSAGPGRRRPLRLLTAAVASLGLAVGTLGLTAPPANAASKSLATQSEYRMIREGQTLERVRDIIDSRGEAVGGGAYVWKSTQGKVVAVFFVDGRVADKERLVVASLSEYRKIDRGDRYSRVKNIIGGRSQLSVQDDEVRYRVWFSPDLRNVITVTFNDNGRVIDKDRESSGDPRRAFRAS